MIVDADRTAIASHPLVGRALSRENVIDCRLAPSKSQPNRSASKMSGGAVAIVLEADVAAVFKSSEAVNALLRSVISAMPSSKRDQAG